MKIESPANLAREALAEIQRLRSRVFTAVPFAKSAVREIKKRSVKIKGQHTSVSLENAFWFGLHEIADERGITPGHLVSEIDESRMEGANLSSAVRLHVLNYYRKAFQEHVGAARAADDKLTIETEMHLKDATAYK